MGKESKIYKFVKLYSTMKKIKNLTRGQVRSLLKRQNGRCALTGMKISPVDVSVDHIIPISRKEFENQKGYGKCWLVHTSVNRMKGNQTLEEFYDIISKVINFKQEAMKLQKELYETDLPEMDKGEFDKYLKEFYNEYGVIKN